MATTAPYRQPAPGAYSGTISIVAMASLYKCDSGWSPSIGRVVLEPVS